MDFEALFPGRFIKAAEFKGREVTLTISALDLVDLPQDTGPEKARGVISFRESKKQWVLNRTNAVCLKEMFGRETDAWLGKRVTLYPAQASFGRERVLAVRVKGSPDIAAPVDAEIKLPRRKPVQMRLVPTGKKQGSAPAAAPIADEEADAIFAAEREPGAEG